MANSLAELGRVNAPRTYNPGRGRSLEQLAYLSPEEMDALLQMTDGRAEMTPHGLMSFADDSARGYNGGYGSGASTSRSYNQSQAQSQGRSGYSPGSGGTVSRPGTGGGGTNVTRSSIPRVPGGYGAQGYDTIDRSYSNPATYSPSNPFNSSGPAQGGSSTAYPGVNQSSADLLRGGYADYQQPPGYAAPPPRPVEGVRGGKGVQAYDSINRAYSNPAVYTPDPTRGPKQFSDSVPIGGPFYPGNTMQRPDRPDYGRNPSPAGGGGDPGYQPSPRQGDDPASQGTQIAQTIAQNVARAQDWGAARAYDPTREARRIQEKNDRNFIIPPNDLALPGVRGAISQFGLNGARRNLGVG
jgi:hypothetical protein